MAAFRAEANKSMLADSARIVYASALKQKSMHRIIEALILRGNASFEVNLDSAYLDYAFALKLADRFNLIQYRPGIFLQTGLLHIRAGNYKMATEFIDSARASAIRTRNYKVLSDALNVLGTIYLDVRNGSAAKQMFEEAYALAVKKGMYRQAGISLGNLARLNPDTDSSVAMMKSALSLIGREAGPGKEKALIYINIANRMTSPDSALFYFLKAIRPNEGKPDPTIVMQACNNMAYSYLAKGEADKASQLLQNTAIPIAEADSNFDWLASLYDTWADVMTFQRDYRGALNLEKRSIEARNKAEIRKSADQIRLLMTLLEVRKKDMLYGQSKLQILTQERDIRSLKNTLLLLAAALFLAGVAVIVIYLRAKIRTQQKELDMTRQKVTLHDYERKRLAMHLHDLSAPFEKNITRRIANLSFTDQEVQEDFVKEWKKISSAIHSISYQLNDTMVQDLPFTALTANLVEEYLLISDLDIDIESDPRLTIKSEMKVNLFFIMQELLNNAMKHVQKGRISLRLATELGHVYLFYQDSGPGFDQEKQQKNDHQQMGIHNIVERAAIMGGWATLETAPGRGTRWTVAIPMH